MSLRQLKITKSITQRESISLNKYLQEIGKLKTITAEEEAEVCKRTREGDPLAYEKLVKANLRFVVSVAKQFQGHGLSLADLVNEGNLGLLYAARKFDETRGFRFISYAVWWIRQEIVRAISQHSQQIRLPVNKTLLRNRIRKMQQVLEQQMDRPASIVELSDAMNLPEEEITDALIRDFKLKSLDEPVGEEDDGCLADMIRHPESEETENRINTISSLQTDISRHLQSLNERQRQTLCFLYGIGGNEPMTLEEISRKFELTPERIRQIRDKALQLLRTNGNFRLLRSYL